MPLSISSATTTLTKLPSCDKGALSAVVPPLAVAAAAPEMPGRTMALGERAEARLNTAALITGFKRVLTTLLDQDGIDVQGSVQDNL